MYNFNKYLNISFALQIATSTATGPTAGVGGEGLAGMVLVPPSVLSYQAQADPPAGGQPVPPPTPHEWRVWEWRSAPPTQLPWALPSIMTTLTPDLLTTLEAVGGYWRILVEVGVRILFKGRNPSVPIIYTPFLLPHTLLL